MAPVDLATSTGTSAKHGPAGFRKRLRRWISPHVESQVTGGLDPSTRLARERTNLALDRSYLAHERTLQAWIRAALSMISFGFTLDKLGTVVKSIKMKGPFSKEYGTAGVPIFY